MNKLAVIRLRGPIQLSEQEERTFHHMNIHRRHYCAIFTDTPTIRGMIAKIDPYITWGEIESETEKEIQRKRGEDTVNKEGKKVLKPYYRLHPPRGGFERKGMKKYFKQGGSLGYRGDKMNALIKRML